MKIKRFKNLWTMGLILSAAILGVVYLLKIFFPQFVIEVAHTESIVTIGRYIDTHKWAWYLATIIISSAFSYIYCCACCGRSHLNKIETIITISSIIILCLIKEFLPAQYTALNIISMVLLPYLFKGNFKNTVICFALMNLLQTMTLEIRNLSLMIIDFNYATFMVLTIDIYILQFILYFLFNFNKEE